MGTGERLRDECEQEGGRDRAQETCTHSDGHAWVSHKVGRSDNGKGRGLATQRNPDLETEEVM